MKHLTPKYKGNVAMKHLTPKTAPDPKNRPQKPDPKKPEPDERNQNANGFLQFSRIPEI
jgi:hypothetical protein